MELKTSYRGRCAAVSVSNKDVTYESSDPSVLRIEGGDAVGIAAGLATVHVRFADSTVEGVSGDVQVVLCEDAGADAAADGADDS